MATYNIPTLRVDGNDMFAVYYAHNHALEQIEKNGGPFALELVSDRGRDHTTAVAGLRPVSPLRKAWLRSRAPLRRNRLFLDSSASENYFGARWSRENELDLHVRLGGTRIFRLAKKQSRILGQNVIKKRDVYLRHILGLDWIKPEDEERYAGMSSSGEVEMVAEESYRASEKALSNPDALIEKAERCNTVPLFEEWPQNAKSLYPMPEVVENANFQTATGFARYFLLSHGYGPNEIVTDGGEDVGPAGGVLRISALPRTVVEKILPDHQAKMVKDFLPLYALDGLRERIFNTPLAEESVFGVFGVGPSKEGDGKLRPIAEIQFDGFGIIGWDQIKFMAKEVQRYGGKVKRPLVGLLPCGANQAIDDHQTVDFLKLANFPGLIIAFPSTVQDLFDLLVALSRSNRPGLLGLHLQLLRPDPQLIKRLRLGVANFWEDEESVPDEKLLEQELYVHGLRTDLKIRPPWQPAENFGIRIAKEGRSNEETSGKSITVVAYGMMVHESLRAAKALEAQHPEVSVEVLDLRLIKPLDAETLIASVRKTHRIVAVQEEPRRYGTMAEILAVVLESRELIGHYLDAPAKRVTGREMYDLFSKLVQFTKPDWKQILKTLEEVLSF